jgi:6-pyruvoyltetrahydropterin/6-carboxytetrahydropterin synthase
LTRRYCFSAVHVLARPDWTAELNREVYGKCANPAGHGHDYGIEVSLRGEVAPESGRLVRIDELDHAVRACVLDRLDGRHLNRDVPRFEREVPTAENIARFVWRALAAALPSAELERVRVIETRNNSVVYSEEREST